MKVDEIWEEDGPGDGQGGEEEEGGEEKGDGERVDEDPEGLEAAAEGEGKGSKADSITTWRGHGSA